MSKISLITVEYRTPDHTQELLRSLEKLKFSKENLQIVVVSTGSEQKQNYTSEKFHIENLHSSKNLGFTGANNFGIRHATETFSPDYFLLLNNDTLVDPEFLQNLVVFAQKKKDVGVICPMIYFASGYEFHSKEYSEKEKGNVVWFAGGSIDWKNMYAFHRGVDEVDRGQFKIKTKNLKSKNELPNINYETMDFATGCCMLIPARVIQEVGMFNDSYFLYWEDVELSYRIKQAGYELYFCPDSKIWHKNAGSSGGSGSDLHTKYQERNRLQFAMRYAPLRTKRAVLKEYLTKRVLQLR